MKKIAFIGIGIMGERMARNLINHGYEVSIFSRTKSKANSLIEEGALWCDTIEKCVKQREVVITMISTPEDVKDVYFKKGGILDCAQRGSYLIDMTTSDPELAIKIYESAKIKGLKSLDAPVSGGEKGAQEGTLSIMVGGREEDFENCKNLLCAMGESVTYQGNAGAGQHTKMANQIMICGLIGGIVEGFEYGRAKGLDLEKMYSSVSKGAARSFQLSTNGLKILKEDKTPGFFIKHFVKDLKIAATNAKQSGLALDVLFDVLSKYETLEKLGMGECGIQELPVFYQKCDRSKEQ